MRSLKFKDLIQSSNVCPYGNCIQNFIAKLKSNKTYLSVEGHNKYMMHSYMNLLWMWIAAHHSFMITSLFEVLPI